MNDHGTGAKEKDVAAKPVAVRDAGMKAGTAESIAANPPTTGAEAEGSSATTGATSTARAGRDGATNAGSAGAGRRIASASGA